MISVNRNEPLKSAFQCELLEGDAGRCVMLYKVQEDHVNKYGTLHGGMGATLVDCVTTFALIDKPDMDPKRLGVSVDMNIT